MEVAVGISPPTLNISKNGGGGQKTIIVGEKLPINIKLYFLIQKLV